MNVWTFAFYTTGVLYALLYERMLIIYFLLVLAIYVVISIVLPGAKNISTRKKIMLGTWTPPSEGVIINRLNVRVDRVLALIETIPKQQRPTLTHFALKACGQLGKEVPDLNGRLCFGKFVPYEQIDISCLVDIEGGKDLAFIKVENIGDMSVMDIAKFIREKASKMKRTGGGQEHKKKFRPFTYVPAFLVELLIEFTTFFSITLGLNLKFLGIKKNEFGSGVVTPIGMLGFEDAVAPFTGATKATFFASVNAAIDTPFVQGDKVIVVKTMNVNFAVDHRYIDGGRCTKLTSTFKRVFEEPEKYLKDLKKVN